MEGICKGCGQIQSVPAVTQEEADYKATMSCNCGEADKFRRREKLMRSIEDICITRSEECGFEPIEEDTVDRIKEAARLVFDGKFDKATFSVEGSLITIKRSNEKVVCNRKTVLTVEGAIRA